jgi:hypothetical protein
MRINLPDKPLELKGQLTWSNLGSCPSLDFNPAMGFYFIRIDEDKDRQNLREAIVAQRENPSRLRRETDQDKSPLLSREDRALGHSKEVAGNPTAPRN